MSETVVRELTEKREVLEIAGREVVLEPLSTYKFNEACRLLAEMIEKFGVGEILESIGGLGGEEGEGEAIQGLQAGLSLAPLLPKVLRQLPEAVVRFVAVCMIPDGELLELYPTPNGIADRVKEVEAEVLFRSTEVQLLHSFGKFLGLLEINSLKNELTQVVETFQGLMGQPEAKPRARRRRG